MGRGIIQHPETKKYAIWSSVVDDFITDWLSEDELKQWQIDEFVEQIKEQPIEVSRFKTYEECLYTIETYHGKDRADEVKDGGKQEEVCYGEPIDCTPFVNDERYACAICECPVPFNYGILIKKSKYIKDSQGFYHFHCNKCGLDGSIFS